MTFDNQKTTWKNCAFVYVIPFQGNNLVVHSFESPFLDWDRSYTLSCQDLSVYEGKMIGFFITLSATSDYWGEYDTEISLGDIQVIAEDGKQAFLENAQLFNEWGSIDLNEFEEFFNEEIELETISIAPSLKQPLYQLSFIRSLDPDFLLQDEKEVQQTLIEMREDELEETLF